jgi:hypothetical protein
MPATEFTTGGGGGGATDTVLIVIVVLIAVGLVLYRLVAPVVKFVLGTLEAVAEFSLKAGLYLTGAGVLALVLAFGYVMFAG